MQQDHLSALPDPTKEIITISRSAISIAITDSIAMTTSIVIVTATAEVVTGAVTAADVAIRKTIFFHCWLSLGLRGCYSI